LRKGLIFWDPRVDRTVRKRIIKGEGTAADAKNLLDVLDKREDEKTQLKKEIYELKNNKMNTAEQRFRQAHHPNKKVSK
jgi:hypothetical protein